jgi:hypothetical protein
MGFAILLAGVLAWGPPTCLSSEKKGADNEGFVLLFGTPTWTIHKGAANTWAFSDDGTILTHRGGGG